MAVIMLLGVVPENVFAEDSRQKISNIVATSDTDSIPKYGERVKRPTFAVTEGSPAYFDVVGGGDWCKKEGEKWKQYWEETFTEGTYRYEVQIRIDDEAGTTHVLDKKGVTATVDGKQWAVNEIPSVADTFSLVWTKSEEYVITAPPETPLDFVKNESWNIPLNYVGKAIKTFSVAAGVAGGEKPYTFSKASGPDWINVANDGTVSGTPNSVGTNEGLVIRVTDNKSATKEITLNVAKTAQDPSTRTKINKIVATSDTDSIPKYGERVKRPTFAVTEGSPAYFDVVGGGDWCKKEGEKWKQYWEETFTEGTYRYEVQIRIDDEAGTTHVLDKKGVTATVDGKQWAVNEIPSVADTFSLAWAKSKEYVISKTAQEKLVDIPKANTNLVYTGNPQTGVNEGTGYTITGNTATNAGTYTAKATLKAGYKWRDGTKEVKNISFEIGKADPAYTAPTGLKGQKGAKLSTVTLPSGFTWVDGEKVLDTVGEKTFKAKFTPADATNYEVIDVDLTVKVEEAEHKITVVNGNSNQASAKQGTSVTVSATVPADKDFDTWEATGITLTDAQKKENPLTITMPDNDVTLTAKFGDKVKLTNIKIKTYAIGSGEWQYLNPPLPYNENTKEYTIELESKIQYFQIELTCDTSKIQAELKNARTGHPMTLYKEDTYYISHSIDGTEQAYIIELSKNGSVIDRYVLKVKRVNDLIETDKPKANTNLVYTGNPQTGVNEGTGYTITGNTATNAGTYTAKATLKAGYKWRDGTKEVKNISFEIGKADPAYTAPTGLKGQKGAKLSTVTLPSGFTWVDGEKVLDTVGEKTFKAKFTPADTNNYKVVELDVKVMVEDNITPPTPTVTGIAVNSTTHKTEYKVGDELDVTNLTIEVTKSDGSKETVNVEKTMVTGFDSSTANPNQELTITYEGKTAKYTIKIEEVAPPPTQTVTGIAVNSTTHKKEYKVGDELDVTNLTIEVTKSDGSKETVNVEKTMVTGFDSSAANPNQELTITYEGKTATYTIKIEEVTPPTTTYTVSFDANGGEGTMPSKTVNAGDIYKLPVSTFAPPTGKEFKAWQVGGEEKNIGDEITVDGDKTVTAVWKDKGSVPPTPPTPPTPTPEPTPSPYPYPLPWIIYPSWYYAYETPEPKEEPVKIDRKIVLTIGMNEMDRGLNGISTDIMMDVAPYIKEGRTMLPVRYVAEGLGFDVKWIESTRTVVLSDGTTKVEIPVDTDKIIVNGTAYTGDVKPEIKKGRTMLSIANIARALGLQDGKDIIWNDKSKTVTIYRTILVK